MGSQIRMFSNEHNKHSEVSVFPSLNNVEEVLAEPVSIWLHPLSPTNSPFRQLLRMRHAFFHDYQCSSVPYSVLCISTMSLNLVQNTQTTPPCAPNRPYTRPLPRFWPRQLAYRETHRQILGEAENSDQVSNAKGPDKWPPEVGGSKHH